jgi:branched-chain amino acid transport system ATP-binding protein
MAAPLVAESVSVSFAGLKALADVTLEIASGRVTGLIGPNGAGKTTLVNMLTGFQAPSEGRITFDGREIGGMKPHQISRMGIARTFQSGRLFGELTVHDNLEVAGVGVGLSRRAAGDRAQAMLEWIGIAHLGERLAAGLPYTDERRVAIGRALMLSPRFLLLDEPAAGMSHEEAEDLAALIRRVVDEHGCGVLLIEHNIGLVLASCDPICVLDSGQVIEQGPPAAIKASEKVRHAYMGTQAEPGEAAP